MKKITLILLLMFGVAYAAPQTMVKVIPFIQNQIVPIHASTFTVTEIQFDESEQIRSVQNGDMAAWTIDVEKSLPNTLFVKPTMAASDTNMTVITDRHTYYFHLTSDLHQNNLMYALKFRYPKRFNKKENINQPHLPSAYHWDYSFHGSTAIMPLHVFDDGRFTYFQLRPGQSLPAIFSIDSRRGEESVVNFRREGRYLVVHRLASQFTLRSGSRQVASIFNNRMIRKRR